VGTGELPISLISYVIEPLWTDICPAEFSYRPVNLIFRQVDCSLCYLRHAGFLLGIFFFYLKMEATCSSETSVDFQQTRWYIPEDRTLHNRRCENITRYIHDDIYSEVNFKIEFGPLFFKDFLPNINLVCTPVLFADDYTRSSAPCSE
jgi:hypothetical protein